MQVAGRRAAVACDHAEAQGAEMPGHALGQQVPGAVVQAIAGIGLSSDEDLDALAWTGDPPRLVVQDGRNSAGGQRVVPHGGFMEPALRTALGGAVVEEQHGAPSVSPGVGRRAGDLGASSHTSTPVPGVLRRITAWVWRRVSAEVRTVCSRPETAQGDCCQRVVGGEHGVPPTVSRVEAALELCRQLGRDHTRNRVQAVEEPIAIAALMRP